MRAALMGALVERVIRIEPDRAFWTWAPGMAPTVGNFEMVSFARPGREHGKASE